MIKIPSYINNISTTEYSIYSKHFILQNIGLNGQKKLKNTKVLIIGAGGLGSPAMLYLVASGIGYIGIIEQDIIEMSNLNRQILYNTEEIQKTKIHTAKNKLQKINPECKIITHSYRIKSKNSLALIKYYDIIVDGTDNFHTRYIIDTSCYQLHKVYIYAGIEKFEGQLAILNYKNGIKYLDIYPKYLELNNNDGCNIHGLLGVITGSIGILQATETLKISLGIGNILDNQIQVYNLLSSSLKNILIYPFIFNSELSYSKYTNKAKNKKYYLISSIKLKYMKYIQKKQILLIDIRDHKQSNIKIIHKTIHIPLSKINIKTTLLFLREYHLIKCIIIYCTTLYRSLIISKTLHHFNIKHYILVLS